MKVVNILTILIFGLVISLTGCEKEGPAEKAGQKVDQVVEDTKENIQHAKDEVEDAIEPEGPAEKIGENVDDAIEETKEEAQKAKDKIEDTIK